MKQLSNKSLAIFLSLTIFIAVFGTIININMIKNKVAGKLITGKAMQGTVEVNVEPLVYIVVSTAEINFGNGFVNQSTDLSTEQMNPNNFNACIDYNGNYDSSNECRGVQIDNFGNVYINLTFNSSEDGNSLFLGDNATDEFRFAVAEGNITRNFSDSCKINVNDGQSLFPEGTSYSANFMNWTTINKSFIYTICHNLSFNYGERSLVFEVNVTVPSDEAMYEPQRERIAYLMFTATGV